MPRPYPPPPVTRPAVPPFNLEDQGKRELAGVLNLNSLPPDVSDGIAWAIACYKATEAGLAETTIGNTLAALEQLKKKGPAYGKTVARLANDQSGVDHRTLAVLQPLAKAVLANKPGAQEDLAQAACARAEELRKHERVKPATEALRYFCGVLRLIFNHAAAPELRDTTEKGRRHCRRFALEVFTIAGIAHADFDAHPERLTEYLGTDVHGG
jgi:hypothetical protein